MNFIAPRAEPLIREIPLTRLAPENVRKTLPDPQADAELKASIAALGLLENLVVHTNEPDEYGAERYAVVAGGRRLPSTLPQPEDNPWVIVGRKPGAHVIDLHHPWGRIRARADLVGVRIHDLRHSFASRALALGESLPMIGKLLGHTQVQTTARYAHLANESVKASGSRIADSIGADILAGESKADAA